jgi:protease-4
MIPSRTTLMRVLTRIFATIGLVVVGSFTFGLLIGFVFGPKPPHIPAHTVLSLDFGLVITDAPDNDPLSALMGEQTLSLRALIHTIDRARKDERVKGLIADVTDVTLSPAQIQEVRAAIGRFRDSGRFAHAYADSFGELGPGNRPYWLASAFEQIWMQPLGALGLTGGALSLPYARDTLDRIGITPDFRQRHEYKGAVDNLTARNLSAPLRQNYRQLLDDLHQTLLEDISSARSIDRTELNRLVDAAPLPAATALKSGLVTHLDYHDVFVSAARAQAGSPDKPMEFTTYMVALQPLKGEPKAGVALIHVDGMILRRSGDSGPFGEQDIAGADNIVAAIHQATEDKTIKAIVLRINSPGGSVPASESIHRALLQAKAQGKFIVVSMGEIAASGGYWIATAADKIIASPATMTGSIGVVGGKMVIGGLTDKLGINWEELGTGTNSTMFSPARPFSPAAATSIDASLDSIYAAFTERVATGRNLDAAKVDAVARGRIWSGLRAKELGLVDELGGLREAFMAVRTHLGLKEEDVLALSLLPAPESTTDFVLKLLGQLVSAPRLGSFSLEDVQGVLHRASGVLSPSGSLVYTGPQNWQ